MYDKEVYNKMAFAYFKELWIFRRPVMKSEHAAVIPHSEIEDATKINKLMFFKDYLHANYNNNGRVAYRFLTQAYHEFQDS